MSNNLNVVKQNILLVGTGFMANEYLKVLKLLDHNIVVVGRGSKNVEVIKSKYYDVAVYGGGIEKFIVNTKQKFNVAIVAVNAEHLVDVTSQLITHGFKKILIEKPGAILMDDLFVLNTLAKESNTQINIAYNRRYYNSVNQLIRMATDDGGILSLHFEFTEWLHTINPSDYDISALNRWIITNSSHIIDLAFFIIGLPKSINSDVNGKNIIDWHKSGSIFTGSGISINNIPFTYHANWLSAGRWSVEVMSPKNKYILKPIEKLQVQKLGSIIVEDVQINQNDNESSTKEGLYDMLNDFILSDKPSSPNIDDQIELFSYLERIANY